MTKAIFTSPYIPPEFIAAHGIEPIRIFPRLEKAERLGFSKVGMCPYAAAFIGEALSAEEGTIVLMATTCDQMRRAADLTWHGHPARGAGREESGRPSRNIGTYNRLPACGLRSQDYRRDAHAAMYHKHPASGLENLGQDASATVFLLNVPATWQTPTSFKLYLDELKRLSKFLKSHGGKEPSREKLISIMAEYDSRRQTVLAQKHLCRATQYAGMLIAQKPVISSTNQDVKNLVNSSNLAVALIGGHFLNDDLYILDMIEEAGGRVALNGMEYGERTFPRKFDRRRFDEDPLLELADAYFGSIPDAFRRPNSALYLWLKKHLEQEKIRGVIFHHYIWCDIWHAELARFKEWTNLPVLDIHAGDDGKSVRSKMRDMIQTFMQVLR